MTDLGLLADPTPSERALSMLRSGCDFIGLLWPPGDDLGLAIIIAEAKAAAMARSDGKYATMANHVALACYWTLSAICAARRHDTETEARHAARALDEHLSWVRGHADGGQ